MKKIILLGILCLLSVSQAQPLLERLQPHAGFIFYDYLGVREKDGSAFFDNTTGINFPAINVGVNYVYMHSNDFMSVGFDPSLNFGLQLTDPVGLLIQTPLFITAKIGANATKYSESTVGFSVGVGGSFTFFRVPVQYGPGLFSFIEGNFVPPAAMAEFTFDNGGTPLSLRFHANLSTVQQDLTNPTRGNTTVNITNYSLGLLYYF